MSPWSRHIFFILFLDSLNSVWLHLQASLCCKSKDWCVLRSFAIHSFKILRSTLISELLTFFTIALQPTQYGSKSTGNVLGASGCLFATRPKYLLRHFLRSSVGQHFVRTLFSKKRQCPSVHQWFCNLWRLWACNAALLLLHYLHFWLKDFKVCKVKKLLNRCCIAIQDELMHSTRYPVLHLQSSIPNTKNIKKPLVRQCNQCNRGKNPLITFDFWFANWSSCASRSVICKNKSPYCSKFCVVCVDVIEIRVNDRSERLKKSNINRPQQYRISQVRTMVAVKERFAFCKRSWKLQFS